MPKTAKSVRPGMKPYWPELETKLHERVLNKQMNGIGIYGTMIRLKAEIMAKEISQSEVAGISGSTTRF